MTSWAALAIAASLVASGVRWPDQRLIAIDADPELLGQRHCSRWFRGLVTIPGGEYIYSASTQRLCIRMYILYDSYGSPKVRRALPTVRAHTNTHSCRAGGDSMQTKRAGGANTPTAHVQCGGGAPPYAGGAWRVTELFTEGESKRCGHIVSHQASHPRFL